MRMLHFFCTICGTRLEIDEQLAGQQARCSHCSNVVRTPTLDETYEVPLAKIASHELPTLSYGMPPWALAQERKHQLQMSHEQAADRLNRVFDDTPSDADGSKPCFCPSCGSTIAPFIRKCPFCRNALWGRI